MATRADHPTARRPERLAGRGLLLALALVASACTSPNNSSPNNSSTNNSSAVGDSAAATATSTTLPDEIVATVETIEVVDDTGTLTADVPVAWDLYRSDPSTVGLRVLEASPDEAAFRLESGPGLQIVAGRATAAIDESELRIMRPLSRTRHCDNLSETRSETTVDDKPAVRFDYEGCAGGGVGALLLIGDESGTYNTTISVVGEDRLTLDTIIESVGLAEQASDAAAPSDFAFMSITDASGRVTLSIPDDWTWDAKPGSATPALGAGPPDASPSAANMSLTTQIDPWPADGDVDNQLRAFIAQLGIDQQCTNPTEPVPYANAAVQGFLVDWFPCGDNRLRAVVFAGTVTAQPDELFSMVALTPPPYSGLDALASLEITARP